MVLEWVFWIHLFEFFVDFPVILFVGDSEFGVHDLATEDKFEIIQGSDEVGALGEIDTNL